MNSQGEWGKRLITIFRKIPTITWGGIREKIIPKCVKMIKKTLFRTIVIGIKIVIIKKRLSSYTIRAAGDLESKWGGGTW